MALVNTSLQCSILAVLIAFVQPAYCEETGRIIVRILGLKSGKGFVQFGLFDSKESFPKEDLMLRKGQHPVVDNQCEFIIPDLPFGDYALAVGHDKNDNGKIDRFLGFPLEPVGVSGYTKRLWAPPNYAKAKFSVKADTTVIEIPLF